MKIVRTFALLWVPLFAFEEAARGWLGKQHWSLFFISTVVDERLETKKGEGSW